MKSFSIDKSNYNIMKNIPWLNSASKLVFLLMAVSTITLTAFGIVEPKDFVALSLMAFTYYFTRDKGYSKSA